MPTINFSNSWGKKNKYSRPLLEFFKYYRKTHSLIETENFDIIYPYKIWDVVLRQRDTEKRAETETELRREERRASRLAPSTRQHTRHQAHPHTPVGPQISRSEVRANGGLQTNLTLYNKCLNVNLTFYELTSQKTINVKLCRFLWILSNIYVKKLTYILYFLWENVSDRR